jgi:hypothetical protein
MTTRGDIMKESKEWIITEHRQVILKRDRPMWESDAFRCALKGSQPSYVVSDHTTRNIYPVHTDSEEN